MKRFLTLALAGALVLGAGSVAYANVCAFDPAPAATLLFPFVVYNYDQGANGYNTIMAITNVSADAQIAHVTLWTDYSTAILDFNILLTGYDIVTFTIRDILANGNLPVTVMCEQSSSGCRPDYIDWGGVFEDGPWSDNNELVAPTGDPKLPDPEETGEEGDPGALACGPSYDAYPGYFENNPIDQFILDFFEDWLTISQQGHNYYNDCTGDPGDDYQNVPTWWTQRDLTEDTWMYITVDVVNWCNKSFPDSPSYFAPPDFVTPSDGGEALPDNVLIGDVQFVNNNLRYSEMDNAVHLEADLDIRAAVTDYNGFPITFYARYANQQQLIDYREPLPSAWALRYQMASLQAGQLKTYIRAFKTQEWWLDGEDIVGSTTEDLDKGSTFPPSSTATDPSALTAFNCLPYTVYAWDEDEDVISAEEGDPWSRPGTAIAVIENLLPLETQEVDAEQFMQTFDAGWFLFIWPGSNSATEAPYQTWMGVKYVLEGLYSGARSGAVMGNYNCFDDQVLPDLGVNYSYVP